MAKKIKKKIRTNRKKPPEKSLNVKIAEIHESQMKELDIAFNTAVESISDIFCKYSILDVASSLFVSYMWLPNIASGIKHQFLLSIFVSLEPEAFSKLDKINSYTDFRDFLQKIYPLLPSFFMLEDYIPEPDWGEVKFYYKGELYKIFYGQELSNVYDYLMLFQIIYETFDKEYRKYSGRSPALELEYCLRLQDEIVAGITSQATAGALSELSPGHIEIPPKEFWGNAIDFYVKYDPKKKCDDTFLENYCIHLGSWPRKYLNSKTFHEMVFLGKAVPKFFIVCEGRYLLTLPRRCSSILFDSWAAIYKRYHKRVVENGMPYSMHIGRELHGYIKARVNSRFLRPLVSAVFRDGSPYETIFSTVFISKDRLILIYVTNPVFSKEETTKELENIAPRLRKAIELFNTLPLTLALHLERENVQFHSEAKLKPELFVVMPQISTDVFSVSVPRSLPGSVMFMDQLLGIVDELEEVDTFTAFLEFREEYDERLKSLFVGPLDVFGSFKDSLGILIEGALDFDFIRHARKPQALKPGDEWHPFEAKRRPFPA